MVRWEYKTIKYAAEGWLLGGKVNEKKLEEELNTFANQGWRLVTIVTSNQAQGQTREILAVLERERTM